MRAVDDGRAGVPGAPHLGEQALARLEIDADGRLVEQQDARLVDDAAGEVQASLHAAGQRLGGIVRALEQADVRERAWARRAGPASSEPLHAGEVPHVLKRGEAGIQRELLRHEADRRRAPGAGA